MASFLDKLNVKTALTSSSNFDLSCDHITTSSFMQYNIAYSRELVPKQKIDINMQTFARLQPLPVPTFGRCRIQNRAFFVPYRTIFPAWQDFITNSRHTWLGTSQNSIPETTPLINSSVLTDFFKNGKVRWNSFGQEQFERPADFFSPTDTVEIKQDFYTPDGYRGQFSYIGRWIYKILTSLGMNIIWDFYNPDLRRGNSISYSALPLLAAAKVYADWYFPSHYASTPEFARVEAIFNMNTPSYSLTVQDLEEIFSLLHRVNYDSDYFTSAWQNPVSPNSDTFSSMEMMDITSSFNYSDPSFTRAVFARNNVETSENGTPVVQNQLPENNQIGQENTPFLRSFSQYALDALKSMTDYMKRHQLVGGRALDRYLSRFGVRLSDEMLRRSVYIGSFEQNMQFGDVLSTADTEGSVLGDYAGKGIGYADGNFTFENDKDYGMLIIVSTIVPKTGYYQGLDRNVMHTTRLDFWTPEFDNLGVQAISKAELFVNSEIDPELNDTNQAPLGIWDSVFGFTPRYAEYKVAHDRLTGDFRCNSINEGMDSWYTLRRIEPYGFRDLVISPDFVNGSDASQYNRIFYNTDSRYDKFNIIHSFEIKSSAPMKYLYDTYDFDSKGQVVVMQANGVKMN